MRTALFIAACLLVACGKDDGIRKASPVVDTVGIEGLFDDSCPDEYNAWVDCHGPSPSNYCKACRERYGWEF